VGKKQINSTGGSISSPRLESEASWDKTEKARMKTRKAHGECSSGQHGKEKATLGKRSKASWSSKSFHVPTNGENNGHIL